MVKLTLKFENLQEKIEPSQRKRLYRYAKEAHKFILLTQEDVHENKWYSSHENVGLSFGESMNLVRSFIIRSSENYPDDPEFIEKMKKIFDGLLETIEQARLNGSKSKIGGLIENVRV